jgi:nitroreductase
MDDASQFEALMARRHSCRAFRPEPVPSAMIERALVMASRTASWCNAQPWHVHIVSGEPLERLQAALLKRARTGAAATPELDWPREYTAPTAIGGANAAGVFTRLSVSALENFRFFGAPHLAVVTSPAFLGTHGVMDCGAWVSSFLLAATSLGLGAIAQAAVASWPVILRAQLPISDDQRVVCGISFGYEDATHPANDFRTHRAPIEAFVTWVGPETPR